MHRLGAEYRARYATSSADVEDQFLAALQRVMPMLDAHVQERSGGARYLDPADAALHADIHTFLGTYRSVVRPTPATIRLLVSRFVHDRLAEYDATLLGQEKRARAVQSRAWMRSLPPPISSRCDDAPVAPDAGAQRLFATTPGHHDRWRQYLQECGVGISRRARTAPARQ